MTLIENIGEPHFKVFTQNGRWYFTLHDAQGRFVTGSKIGHKKRSECMSAIQVVQQTTSGTKVVFLKEAT